MTAADLTFEEQAALTAGIDLWHTAGVERIGLPGLGVTDGPSGARGAEFTGSASTSLPCGTALAATWNRELIGRVGRLLGDEARDRGASVLLAPTVNLHRHPLGGRNFECYSEDPYLTAEIAVAYIDGVQSRGVGCAVKHFVCNDQETDRMEIDVVVDERTRRELYLLPFEAAVRRAGVWAVMAAYNRVDGQYCSEHAGLLTDLLRDEWGFDGVVMSDWFGTHGAGALAAGLDLEMPGPPMFLGHHLAAAIEASDVSPEDVERAAGRVVTLVERTAPSRAAGVAGEAPEAVARDAATEAIVLLANDGVLPLDATAAPRLAVIGWRAERPEFQGGGSAQVNPTYVISPVQGLTERLGEDRVTFRSGRVDARTVPISGTVALDYFAAGDLAGRPVRRETLRETTAVWIGDPAPGVTAGAFSARMATSLTPDVSGPWSLSVSGVGAARLFLDGELVADSDGAPSGAGILGLFTTPVEAEVDLVAGTNHAVMAELDAEAAEGPIAIAGLTIEVRRPTQPDAVERAVQAAAAADVAIVVVGRDDPETEGLDAVSMDLPPEQVDLIDRVAAANPRTIVAVNTASPVTMDWADDVAAIVALSYLGQETGTALAAVLFGDADASGRLTTTHPRRIEDAPAHAYFPGRDRRVEYAEGLFMGYRHYDRNGVDPRWCFGHGLSFTTFAYGELTLRRRADDPAAVSVSLEVSNTGDRPGDEVVQLYVRPLDSPVARPDRELKAFAKITLDPGETTTVSLELDERSFAHWDAGRRSWHAAPGPYELLVGSSSRAVHRTAAWTLPGGPP